MAQIFECHIDSTLNSKMMSFKKRDFRLSFIQILIVWSMTQFEGPVSRLYPCHTKYNSWSQGRSQGGVSGA